MVNLLFAINLHRSRDKPYMANIINLLPTPDIFLGYLWRYIRWLGVKQFSIHIFAHHDHTLFNGG